MASNPNWTLGYVPSASEWNGEFAGKVDYPASISQGGTGAQTAAGARSNLVQRTLITSSVSPFAATALGYCWALTGTGAITINLPQLSGLKPGDWVEVADVDFNANVNNITLAAFSGDVIAFYGSSAASQLINLAGGSATLVVNTASWRMLV